MTLTILSQAHLPLSFWDYVVVSNVYLINRLPTPLLNGDIPYQKLFNKIPDYKFLKVFGCSWFPLLCPYNTYKFEPRSQKCIFLGYSMSHKGYRCLAANGRLYISKDVFFNEDRFPYTDLFFPPKPTSSPSTPTNPISVFTYTYSTSCCHHLNSVRSLCFPSPTLPQPSPILPQPSPGQVSSNTSQASPSTSVASISDDSGSGPLVREANVHPMCTRAKSGIVKPRLNFTASTCWT